MNLPQIKSKLIFKMTCPLVSQDVKSLRDKGFLSSDHHLTYNVVQIWSKLWHDTFMGTDLRHQRMTWQINTKALLQFPSAWSNNRLEMFDTHEEFFPSDTCSPCCLYKDVNVTCKLQSMHQFDVVYSSVLDIEHCMKTESKRQRMIHTSFIDKICT